MRCGATLRIEWKIQQRQGFAAISGKFSDSAAQAPICAGAHMLIENKVVSCLLPMLFLATGTAGRRSLRGAHAEVPGFLPLRVAANQECG
jgi:hypothetical protein